MQSSNWLPMVSYVLSTAGPMTGLTHTRTTALMRMGIEACGHAFKSATVVVRNDHDKCPANRSDHWLDLRRHRLCDCLSFGETLVTKKVAMVSEKGGWYDK